MRPKIHSLSEKEVLDRVRALVEAGHREIVLTGIFLGAYGKSTTRPSRFDEPGSPLADLIAKILDIPDLGRLRLSSLEPRDLTPALMGVLAGSPKVAGHLHLPLQSGSDNILRRMGRQYRSADYLLAAENARNLMPNLALTADVIVGFPGETEEDFRQTLLVCENAQFAKIHIFPYSPRPGTPAFGWKDRMVSPKLLGERLKRLRRLERDLARGFRERFSGRRVRVLVEQVERRADLWYCQGRADEYFLVRFPGRRELDNEFCPVKITSASAEPLEGEVEE